MIFLGGWYYQMYPGGIPVSTMKKFCGTGFWTQVAGGPNFIQLRPVEGKGSLDTYRISFWPIFQALISGIFSKTRIHMVKNMVNVDVAPCIGSWRSPIDDIPIIFKGSSENRVPLNPLFIHHIHHFPIFSLFLLWAMRNSPFSDTVPWDGHFGVKILGRHSGMICGDRPCKKIGGWKTQRGIYSLPPSYLDRKPLRQANLLTLW
jgi:hypothetical protein